MVVGLDGCRAGWFAVRLNPDNTWTIQVFPTVNHVWNEFQQAQLILIDIPIGLREAGHQERQCDIEARQHLGQLRQSSVFPVPCRQATRAADNHTAKLTNQQITGRSLSNQTLAIMPKIHQVDMFLLANQPAQNVIREVHPEVCFWSLAGHHAMEHKKKSHEGHAERMAILRQHYPNADQILNAALHAYSRNQVSRDDIADAMVAATTASIVIDNGIHFLPAGDAAPIDPQGLRMEMIYAL